MKNRKEFNTHDSACQLACWSSTNRTALAGSSLESEIEPSAAVRRGTVTCFSSAQGRRRGSISFLKNARSFAEDKPGEQAGEGSSGDQEKRSSPMFSRLRSARHSSNQFASSSTTHRVTRPLRPFHVGGGTTEMPMRVVPVANRSFVNAYAMIRIVDPSGESAATASCP